MSLLTNLTNCTDATLDPFRMCKKHQEGVFVWAFFSVVSFVFGFPAAVAVLWDMLQRRRKGDQFTPYDVFMLNVAVLDGILLFFTLPQLYNYLYGYNLEFDLGMTFFFAFNLCGRPLFTTCICLDCYLAVVHPVVYRANKSLTPRVLTAGVVWTVTFLYGGILTRYYGLIGIRVEVLFFAITLPIIGFCDATIFWTLRRSNPTEGGVHPKKKKALQIIINNLVISFTSYLPPVIGVLVSKFLNMDEVITVCHVSFTVLCSVLVGNAMSPIMYLNNLGKLEWLKCLNQN